MPRNTPSRRSGKRRVIVAVSVLLAVVAGVTAGCVDRSPTEPSVQDDTFAERVLVSTQLSIQTRVITPQGVMQLPLATMRGKVERDEQARNQLTIDPKSIVAHGSASLLTPSSSGASPLITAPAFSLGNGEGSNGASAPKHHIVSMKQRNGDVFSFALFDDDDESKPAKRVYTFKNGVIQSIYSMKYKRVNGVWVPKQTKQTMFLNGELVAQQDIDWGDGLLAAMRDRANSAKPLWATAMGKFASTIGAVVLPDAAYAQGVTELPTNPVNAGEDQTNCITYDENFDPACETDGPCEQYRTRRIAYLGALLTEGIVIGPEVVRCLTLLGEAQEPGTGLLAKLFGGISDAQAASCFVGVNGIGAVIFTLYEWVEAEVDYQRCLREHGGGSSPKPDPATTAGGAIFQAVDEFINHYASDFYCTPDADYCVWVA